MSFVFLYCTERSGSNFIASVMNGHSEISGPPPSHLFRLFGLNCHNYFPTTRDENWHAFIADFVAATQNMIGEWNANIEPDALNAACPNRSIGEALTYLYRLECKGKEHISFVKENYAYLIAPFLFSHWPEANYVYQVRDPRDVAASWLKTRTMPGGVVRAVDNWVRDQTETLKIFRQMQASGRIMLVRYEDLITEPHNVIPALCNHIGVAYEDSMLEFYKDRRTQKNASRISAWSNLAKPILHNNSGKYKKTLTQTDIRYTELRCAELMVEFGYALETDAATMAPKDAQDESARLEADVSEGEGFEMKSATERTMRAHRLELIERIKTREAVQ